jgi:tetratricopeptide (TPR) repeat protein
MDKIVIRFVTWLFILSMFTPVCAIATQTDINPPQALRSQGPLSREEQRHLRALELYAVGLLLQENDRLVEATQAFEAAHSGDPQAMPPLKALVPLYLALRRTDDALAACRKALKLAPEDYETWIVYARQLKNRGSLASARDALASALKSETLAAHPEVRVQICYDLGILCTELKDAFGALEAFGEVVKILGRPEPLIENGLSNREVLREQAANVYERMIKLCIDVHQHERALRLFGEAQSQYPAETRRLHYAIARLRFERGELDLALAVLDQHLRNQPRNIEGYELRSAILAKLGREAEIVPALEQFAAQDGQNVALQLYLAQEYVQYNRPLDAERVYAALLERSPSPELYQALFRLYRTSGVAGGVRRILDLLDGAIRATARKERPGPEEARFAVRARDMLAAIRTDREVGAALTSTARDLLAGGGRLHPQTLCFLAALAARSRQLEEAEVFYRRCLGSADGRDMEFAVYRGLIQTLWQAHKYQELADVCRHGLEQGQAANRVVFHLHLSQVLLILGKIEEAVAEAGKAVERADADRRLSARLNRMDVLSRADRASESIAEGEALLRECTRPGEIRDIRLRLSSIYSAEANYEKSEEQLQLILKVDAQDPTANNDLGYLWADRGKNLEEAERLIRKAIELDTEQRKSGAGADEDADNAAYLDSLGWVLHRRGRPAEARGWLEKAAALAGGAEDPVVWDHLGDVYFSMKDNNRAKIAWQRSISLYEIGAWRKKDKHYKELQQKLRQLDSATQPP